MANLHRTPPESKKRAAQWCPPSTGFRLHRKSRIEDLHCAKPETNVRDLASLLADDDDGVFLPPKMTKGLGASNHSSTSELSSLVGFDETSAVSGASRFDTPPCTSSAFESAAELGQLAPKKPETAVALSHGNPIVLKL